MTWPEKPYSKIINTDQGYHHSGTTPCTGLPVLLVPARTTYACTGSATGASGAGETVLQMRSKRRNRRILQLLKIHHLRYYADCLPQGELCWASKPIS